MSNEDHDDDDEERIINKKQIGGKTYLITGSPVGPRTTRLSLLERSRPMQRNTLVSRAMDTKSLMAHSRIQEIDERIDPAMEQGTSVGDMHMSEGEQGRRRDKGDSRTEKERK